MDSTTANTFDRIAVLAHPLVEDSIQKAAEVAEFLNGHVERTEYGYLNDQNLRQRVESKEFSLVIILGGDGTVLRAGHLCAPVQVPILPINMGSFGFLIEVSLDDWQESLTRLLAGDYWIEERMMLCTKVWREGSCIASWDVLNEAAIARGPAAKHSARCTFLPAWMVRQSPCMSPTR
jgi:NAD+ kinase